MPRRLSLILTATSDISPVSGGGPRLLTWGVSHFCSDESNKVAGRGPASKLGLLKITMPERSIIWKFKDISPILPNKCPISLAFELSEAN